MMKKLLYLFALLTIFVSGTNAQVTDRASAGDPMTFSEFKALAETGKHFAIVGASDNTQFCYPNWFGFTATFVRTLTADYLFDLENSTTGDGWYNIKRVSDGKYVSAEGGNFDESTKLDFKLVNRRAGDYASEFANSDLHVSLDNAAGNHYNLNTVNLGFRGGTGGYSTYITYGPLYLVTVHCINSETGDPLQESVTFIAKDGTTINAPEIAGYTPQGTTSVTVDGSDKVLTVNYEASSITYTVSITGDVPVGTTVTIKGESVNDGGTVSSLGAINESDVAVTFPTGYEYMAANVTISGTTITVNCYDNRWAVSFDKDATFSRTDRKTTYVKLGDETISFDGQKTIPCIIYNDETAQHFTQPVGATVTPTFGFTGNAMMGYVYIDYNNDGDFTDEGELVSYWNEGDKSDQLQNHNRQTPAFTLTSTPGSYRMRFKVDWNNTDPLGTGPAGVNNYIGDNGGVVLDVTIDVKNYYQPATNKFYRFKIEDNYMCNVADGEGVRTVTTTNNDASTIFYLNSSNQLIAYADGFGFNYGYCKAAAPGIFNTFDFLESTTAGTYFIHSNPGTESNEYSNRYINIDGTKLAEGRGAWTIEEVDELPVTISCAKFATLYAPVALTIPSTGVKVYTAIDDDKYLHLNKIEGQTIPANTGVILEGEAGTYNFNITNDVTPISSALTGTVAAIARPNGSYILATGSADVAFYADGAQTIPGFKAYLPAGSGSSPVKSFVFGDETAVKAIEAAQNSDKVVYDMSGRRVLNPAKGLYIMNGKKVVIK